MVRDCLAVWGWFVAGCVLGCCFPVVVAWLCFVGLFLSWLQLVVVRGNFCLVFCGCCVVFAWRSLSEVWRPGGDDWTKHVKSAFPYECHAKWSICDKNFDR